MRVGRVGKLTKAVTSDPGDVVSFAAQRRYTRITFHPHARQQMKARKISGDQVRRALNDPDATRYESRARHVAKVQTQTGATLRVVFVEQNKVSAGEPGAFVITVISIGK